MPYKSNIESKTLHNRYYRKVLYTTKQLQLVVMKIQPRDDIGSEVHAHTSQFIRVEGGSGKAIIGNKKYKIKDGDAVIIPSGVRHNIIAGSRGLKLYSVYSPPEHPPSRRQLLNLKT